MLTYMPTHVTMVTHLVLVLQSQCKPFVYLHREKIHNNNNLSRVYTLTGVMEAGESGPTVTVIPSSISIGNCGNKTLKGIATHHYLLTP